MCFSFAIHVLYEPHPQPSKIVIIKIQNFLIKIYINAYNNACFYEKVEYTLF